MGRFDFQEMLSAFIVLFAVIDIIGAIPIVLDLKHVLFLFVLHFHI